MKSFKQFPSLDVVFNFMQDFTHRQTSQQKSLYYFFYNKRPRLAHLLLFRIWKTKITLIKQILRDHLKIDKIFYLIFTVFIQLGTIKYILVIQKVL